MMLYSMDRIENLKINAVDTFIFVIDEDERSTNALNHFTSNEIDIENIIVIKYSQLSGRADFEQELIDRDAKFISNPHNQAIFFKQMFDIKHLFKGKIVIDMSCMKVPELFSLMKLMKKVNETIDTLHVIYSTPFDYVFEGAYTSYSSFTGDMSPEYLIGYADSFTENESDLDLFIFMGFESTQSNGVYEYASYKSLTLVNSIPAYYQKYKDISILNNISIEPTKNMLRVPANNPFEVFNLLTEVGHPNMCVAPLGTKPVALGVCMYALKNEIKVIYPIPHEYKPRVSHNVHETLVYDLTSIIKDD